MKTYDEAHWAEREAAASCRLCEGTGYVQNGMVIHHDWVDDHVEWVANLVACSHGVVGVAAGSLAPTLDAIAASGMVPGGADTNRTDAMSLVGGGTDGETAGTEGVPEGAPAVSLAERIRAHDARVAADTEAYENRGGGA